MKDEQEIDKEKEDEKREHGNNLHKTRIWKNKKSTTQHKATEPNTEK